VDELRDRLRAVRDRLRSRHGRRLRRAGAAGTAVSTRGHRARARRIILGKYLAFVWVGQDELGIAGLSLPVFSSDTVRLFWDLRSDVWSGWDLLWAGLAVVTAYRIPQHERARAEQPSAPAGEAHLSSGAGRAVGTTPAAGAADASDAGRRAPIRPAARATTPDPPRPAPAAAVSADAAVARIGTQSAQMFPSCADIVDGSWVVGDHPTLMWVGVARARTRVHTHRARAVIITAWRIRRV
jgi:hypothetical protein